MPRLLGAIELLFWLSFWWQTRVNLSHWWPSWFSSPLNSDYLIPFVYLSDMLLAVLLGIWVIDRSRQLTAAGFKRAMFGGRYYGLDRWIRSPLAWLMLLVIAASVSVMMNNGGWWSWYGWWRLMEGVLFSWYISDRWQLTQPRRYALRLLLAGLVVNSVMMIGEWLIQRSLGMQWLGEWSFSVFTPGVAKVVFNGQEYLRSYGTFAHPNIAAGILVLGMALLGWWKLDRLMGSHQKLEVVTDWPRWHIMGQISGRLRMNESRVSWVALGVLAAGLFVTFSRSAWLVGVVAGALLVVWQGKRGQKLIQSRWLTGLMVGVVAISVAVGPMIWSRFNSLDDTDRLSVERRVQLNEVGVGLVAEHPEWGVGLNNFVVQLANYGPLYGVGIWREPVHNLYLLILVEVGIVGLIIWLVAHGLIWIQIGLLSRREAGVGWVKLLIVLWLAVLLLGLIDHYWWTSQQGRLVWWLLVGSSLAVLKVERNQGRVSADSTLG